MTTQQLLVPSNATLKRNVMDYSLIVVGSFLQALSYVLFLAPYKIVPGGVYGISIVIHYVTKDLFPFFPDGLPMGATALCFNIPLMILAMKKIGLSSGPKTIVTFLLVSNMIIVLDSAVVLLGLIVFKDWAVPLYSWFTIFVYGKIVEMFQTENPNRAVFIVSRKTQELKTLIVDKMGMRGTFIHGKGMYQGNETEIIFTIAERKDMPRLKDEVKEIDPNAFVSTMHASKDSPRPGI